MCKFNLGRLSLDIFHLLVNFWYAFTQCHLPLKTMKKIQELFLPLPLTVSFIIQFPRQMLEQEGCTINGQK